MDQNINDSKSRIWNFFSENIVLGIQLFHIRQHVPLNIIRDFFKFQISWQKVSKPTITSEKNTHFTKQLHSKNLTHFANLNPLDIENKILPQHSQNTFSLYKCSSKDVSVWCQKKHLHCPISGRSRTAFLNYFEVTRFTVFQFNWNFWKLNYFSAFWYLHL